jgi:hypothetical protein
MGLVFGGDLASKLGEVLGLRFAHRFVEPVFEARTTLGFAVTISEDAAGVVVTIDGRPEDERATLKASYRTRLEAAGYRCS